MKNYNTNEIRSLLTNAKSALIAVPQLSLDSIGSALALGLLLQKRGLDVKVYCPQKPDNNYSKLSGLNLLSDTYNLNDLVVSLNYPLDQIENVTYNDDGGRLNLIVKTKANAPKIEDSNIIISNQSQSNDICFMIGDEAGLGPNAAIVNKGNWVFVSPTNAIKPWAKATLIDQDAPYSEIFTFLFKELGLSLTSDVAKNLLISLRVATQSFSVNVSPETFEAGAICLRATQQAVEPELNKFDNQSPIEEIENKPSSVSIN